MARRLQWMIGGRLVVASLLVLAMVSSAIGPQRLQDYTPQFLSTVTVCTFGLSLFAAIWLTRGKWLRLNAAIQIAGDLALTTSLLLVTGGAGSVLTFLYGIIILAAGLVVGPRALVFTSLGAFLLYGLVAVGITADFIPAPPDQLETMYRLSDPELRFSVLSNTIGLMLVALLAGNLSVRLARVGLSAAELARLNTDIVRSIPTGILTTDLNGNIVTINEAGRNIFGVDATPGMQRKLAEHLAIDRNTPDPFEGPRRSKGVATRADGSKFPIGYTVTSLINTDGSTTGTLVAFQDLTEITELRKAAQRVERMAVLGRLAVNLAHEIRNPLSSISGSVELVCEANELSEEDRRLLSTIAREVDRLNHLVTTMLDVAKPREPTRVPSDLVGAARSVIEVARQGLAGDKDVQIELRAEPAEIIAALDAEQIRQVLWNLVKNAVEAAPIASTVTVAIQEHGADVVLDVIDRGEGVPSGSEERIFEAFHSEGKHGVGLGLALTRQIVEAHGGRITVEPKSERGACFRVRLPTNVAL